MTIKHLLKVSELLFKIQLQSNCNTKIGCRKVSKIKININEYIKVNLTAYGIDIFSSYYIKNLANLTENEILKYIDSKFENGLLKIQMWEFCYIFGNYMLNGNEQLIHKNEIRIDE